jgi:uncharacterized damage-inducible protein DinB
MTHPLVEQLRFTRNEWRRALEGVSDEEARRRFEPMNSISWIIGHLAWQEQRYWLFRGLGKVPFPELNELVGYGRPACTPPLKEMWNAWENVTQEADPFLDTLTSEILQTFFTGSGEPDYETAGTRLLRVIHHYWYHMGEIMAIRQLLGHTNLPEFVGDIDIEAPYRPEITQLEAKL